MQLPAGHGTPFVLSAPSGTGKTTLAHRLVREMTGLRFSVSHTTRAPRGRERDGIDYHFVSAAKFGAMAKRGEFLEHARVFGKRYGTGLNELERAKAAGEDLLLDIDVQGGAQIRDKRRDAILILLLPPSFAELRRRLEGRGEDDPGEIAKRLRTARWELGFARRYHHLVVNDDADRALRELSAVITAARTFTARRRDFLKRLAAEMA